MLNFLWAGMLVIGCVAALYTGKGVEELTAAAFAGADAAVTLAMGLVGALMLWSGVMKLAEKSGLTDGLARILAPILKRILPGLKEDSPAMSAVVMNVSANLLGLGNAATPFGLKAMQELKKISRRPGEASDEMITFMILNTASVTFIPTLVISLRLQAGSAAPGEVILPSLLASTGGLVFGLVLHNLLKRRF